MPYLSVALSLLTALSLSSCAPGPDEPVPAAVASPSPPSEGHTLEEVARIELPDELKEISGMTLLDGRILGAVNDEQGVLYFVDIATGQISDRKKFGKKGDYEGIALAGRRLYVLRSDGSLFEITNWGDSEPGSEEIETGLKKSCDAEGLAFDGTRGRLLVACKEKGGKGMKGDRAIYGFDPAANRVSDDPVYVLREEDFRKGKDDFKPSGLAIHPSSGDVYVLSSVRKAVVVLASDGSFREEIDLSDAGLEQPEGMVILPEGDVLISSEGVKHPAVLTRFRIR